MQIIKLKSHDEHPDPARFFLLLYLFPVVVYPSISKCNFCIFHLSLLRRGTTGAYTIHSVMSGKPETPIAHASHLRWRLTPFDIQVALGADERNISWRQPATACVSLGSRTTSKCAVRARDDARWMWCGNGLWNKPKSLNNS